MRRLGAGCVALVVAAAAAASAHAADLPIAAPGAPPAPAYMPAFYNWTGFYFGGHVGVGFVTDNLTQTVATALEPAGMLTRVDGYGVVGGAQLGVNFEFRPWVIGVEATWSASDISGSRTYPTFVGGAFERAASTPKQFATAAGRFGYAFNDLLVYGKAGFAWTEVDYFESVLTAAAMPANAFSQQFVRDSRIGFVAGAGLEYAFTEHLSAKVEYDFLDFGSANYIFTGLIAPGGVAVGPVQITNTSYVHFITIGLNYRFDAGGGGPPLIARY